MTVQDFVPQIIPGAKIKVIGCGWAWGKTVTRMMTEWLQGVEFVIINTDAQDLALNPAPSKINIWLNLTRGLWAGADPEIGRKAAEENIDDIKAMLQDTDMVFITWWMGWGTGTGAAPVVGEIAMQMGILTVWVVTEPFGFEGKIRRKNAEEWVKKLKEAVDTLIIIPNDRIFNIIDKKTTFKQAFNMIDKILFLWVQGISDLIIKPGDINVDFADVNRILRSSGTALLGIGYGAWEKRAVEAARKAIDNPLLSSDLYGAKKIIFAVTGGMDLTPIEVQEAANIIEDILDDNAEIIWGMTLDETFEDEVKVTIIATWFEQSINNTAQAVSSRASSSRSEDFITRGISSNNTAPVAQPVKEEMKLEDDIETPAFMRKRL